MLRSSRWPASRGARACILGDSITTDHISPAGSIKDTSPAGRWLIENGVIKADLTATAHGAATIEVMAAAARLAKRGIKN